MIRLAEVTVTELVVSDWPHRFACAITVPLAPTPAAHTEAGHRAALRALALAGCDADGLPPRSGRRPSWPTGFVGSIAHDDELAVAVAARTDVALTLGIDVERHDALAVADATVVLSDDELAFVGDDAALATLLWSAKEAAYKAWCTGLDVELERVDPRDIRVHVLDRVALQISAVGELADRVAAIGTLSARSLRKGNLVITAAWKLRPDAG
ncbi:MAG: 4'-phosphopantetheinyl transferase superfamily protein [Acidimicrobiales bacterium]